MATPAIARCVNAPGPPALLRRDLLGLAGLTGERRLRGGRLYQRMSIEARRYVAAHSFRFRCSASLLSAPKRTTGPRAAFAWTGRTLALRDQRLDPLPGHLTGLGSARGRFRSGPADGPK